MVMMLSSSSPPFFQIPTLVIQPRKQQQLLWKAPPFHQTTLQLTLFTSVYLPCPLRRNLHKCFLQKQSQSAQEEEQAQQQEQEQTFEFERLFSNLNQATLKREPGSLSRAIFLVAGTTVGAGILAIPAVTQEAGFLASAVTCIFCWVFMVVTGLLIAEGNVNTMCELGGVSLLVIHLHPLCPSCCLCGPFFRYLDKFSWHSHVQATNSALNYV